MRLLGHCECVFPTSFMRVTIAQQELSLQCSLVWTISPPTGHVVVVHMEISGNKKDRRGFIHKLKAPWTKV